jgi:hypothetical protein
MLASVYSIHHVTFPPHAPLLALRVPPRWLVAASALARKTYGHKFGWLVAVAGLLAGGHGWMDDETGGR